MTAPKLVPDVGRPLVWGPTSATWVAAHAIVERGAAEVGSVVLVASAEADQWWSFKLLLHNDEVYRVDTRPLSNVANHPNPWNRPEGFAKSVRGQIHEHVYIENLGVECARAIACDVPHRHAEALAIFCKRARLEFRRECPPPPDVQPRMF